jgi:hypothetical protein
MQTEELGAIRMSALRKTEKCSADHGDDAFDIGSAIIETALTLPVICYLIFFTLELVKINLVRSSIETMATEATFSFVFKGSTVDFDGIIAKYRPEFLPRDSIRYWFRFYDSPAQMCAMPPYGGEDVAWPAENHLDVENIFIDSRGTGSFLKAEGNIDATTASRFLDGTTPPSGKVFVLTLVCDYVFSGALVKGLFSGGSNTTGGSDTSRKYLLWGRGVGMVNQTLTP